MLGGALWQKLGWTEDPYGGEFCVRRPSCVLVCSACAWPSEDRLKMGRATECQPESDVPGQGRARLPACGGIERFVARSSKSNRNLTYPSPLFPVPSPVGLTFLARYLTLPPHHSLPLHLPTTAYNLQLASYPPSISPSICYYPRYLLLTRGGGTAPGPYIHSLRPRYGSHTLDAPFLASHTPRTLVY